MIRAFIAVALPEEIQTALANVQSQLKQAPQRAKVSWTRVSNIHLTLQFLGDVEELLLPKISAALDEVSARHAAFDVDIRGVGTFPGPKRPRVIWVGCDDPRHGLTPLAGAVQAATEQLGMEPERRAFAAHLTLGRIRDPRPDLALTRAIDSFRTMMFGTLRVDALHLLQSRLHPEGSIYTNLSSHNLARRNPTPKET